jgi:hypothetical protein
LPVVTATASTLKVRFCCPNNGVERNIHYVTITKRTTWEFCQLLDQKVIKSKKGFKGWLDMANDNEWIKKDE